MQVIDREDEFPTHDQESQTQVLSEVCLPLGICVQGAKSCLAILVMEPGGCSAMGSACLRAHWARYLGK